MHTVSLHFCSKCSIIVVIQFGLSSQGDESGWEETELSGSACIFRNVLDVCQPKSITTVMFSQGAGLELLWTLGNH